LAGAAQAGFVQVTFPPHFAAKAADAGLGVDLHKKAQTSFYGCPLGVRATAAHCLMDKLIIDFNVRPHERSRCVRIHDLCV
jgi:hypothetical protein